MIITSNKNNTFVISNGNPDAWVQNGNSFGAIGVIGTTDNYDVDFIRNGSTMVNLGSSTVNFFGNAVRIFSDGSVFFANELYALLGDGSASVKSLDVNTTIGLFDDGSASFANGDVVIDNAGNITTNRLNISSTTGSETLYFLNSVPATTTIDSFAIPATVYGSNVRLMGSPAEWVRISINGTSYKIPCYNQ